MTDHENTTKTGTPMSPRRKRYWIALGFAGAVGGVIGAWMQLQNPGGPADGLALFSNGPLTTSFAVGASAMWVVGLILCLALYHRAIDDHEERAWLWAGLAGWYAFVVPAPAWWVLHRADMAPPVDAMALFVLSLLVNGIVWLWLKFR